MAGPDRRPRRFRIRMIAAVLLLAVFYGGPAWLLTRTGVSVLLVGNLVLLALGVHLLGAYGLVRAVAGRPTGGATGPTIAGRDLRAGLEYVVTGLRDLARPLPGSSLRFTPVGAATMGLFVVFVLFVLYGWWQVVGVVALITLFVWVYVMADGGLDSQAINAVVVDFDEASELHAMLGRLCAMTGQPKPRLAISPQERANSYTIGLSRDTAVIVITEGLRRRLTPEELTAVLAHELAHLRHRDVAFMTILSAPATILTTQGRWLAQLYEDAMRKGGLFDHRPRWMVIGVPLLCVAAFPAMAAALTYLPIRVFSRHRELTADRAAAQQLARPADLADALTKLHDPANPTEDPRSTTPHALGIVGPPPQFDPAYAPHPPLQTRLAQLTA